MLTQLILVVTLRFLHSLSQKLAFYTQFFTNVLSVLVSHQLFHSLMFSFYCSQTYLLLQATKFTTNLPFRTRSSLSSSYSSSFVLSSADCLQRYYLRFSTLQNLGLHISFSFLQFSHSARSYIKFFILLLLLLALLPTYHIFLSIYGQTYTTVRFKFSCQNEEAHIPFYS